MSSAQPPQIAVELPVDDRHRVCLTKPLRNALTVDASAFRAVWNEEDERIELYPVEQ